MNRSSEVSQEPQRRWAPSPLLYGSAALHLGAAVTALLRPAAWPWVLGAVAVNHGVLAAAGLWPRSQWLGTNWTELPECNGAVVSITIDDGPDPTVTPRVLDILERHRAVATFFCVGDRVLEHADLAQEIVRRGHAIENHSQRHRHNFSLLGPKSMSAEIARAQDSIERVTGLTPRFFRAPAGLRNPFLDPVLTHLNLTLASWTRRGFDTVDRNPATVLDRLTEGLAARDILLLHDGHAARAANGRPVVLEVLPSLLEAFEGQQLKTITLRAARLES
jgi:peptidoglycan/xylan/chitin deacetylase (PgdA/CDA1 family)